ncbi:DUF4169 family protein [Methylobacterium sp. Leaf108]|uniref:DUF4169 family protein n=1 Tax=Methylobacterium sp. Leaf108 TaxID=1736256 RepID=UPI0006FC4C74|nr:DUF4169 family protein [Methylobacterium sp. Leaf108]KQP55128.1 hypothetical protein ASF39_05240 [Methylobacterium sp. Leaf108]
MAEIINLLAARKAKARGEKEETAKDNRILFGRPKKARTLAEAKKAIEVSRHEGHKLVGRDEEG